MIMKKDKIIKYGDPCLIIAEAGSNHNNDLNLAKKLIDVASEAKADAVKFQLFTAKGLYPSNCGFIELSHGKVDFYKVLEKLELPLKDKKKKAEVIVNQLQKKEESIFAVYWGESRCELLTL
ncbi:hypothetical protein LCGC14_2312320, partial [marine sediment metagenome]